VAVPETIVDVTEPARLTSSFNYGSSFARKPSRPLPSPRSRCHSSTISEGRGVRYWLERLKSG
jgi:hypothetical protein